MARIPYPDLRDSAVEELADMVRRERGGRLPMLFVMQMYNEDLLRAWLSFGTALRYQSTVDDRSRELAICMVSRLLKYGFQFDAHRPLAVAAGLEGAAVDQLPSWRSEPGFSEMDRTVLEYCELLHGEADIADPFFDVLTRWFPKPRTLMELTATIAFYGSAGRFLKVLRIRADDAVA